MKPEITKKEWRELQRQFFAILMLKRLSASACFMFIVYEITLYLVPRICYRDRLDFVAYGVTGFLVFCLALAAMGFVEWFIKNTWKKAEDEIIANYSLKRD